LFTADPFGKDMTQEKYLELFKQLCDRELAITTAKNSDYADEDNAFANFEIIRHLSSGRITPEQGFVVRMSDKLQRIVNLTSRPNRVLDETIEDTLFDLAVYCKLFQCYLMAKKEGSSNA
jgi:hypothetical protein